MGEPGMRVIRSEGMSCNWTDIWQIDQEEGQLVKGHSCDTELITEDQILKVILCVYLMSATGSCVLQTQHVLTVFFGKFAWIFFLENLSL